MSKIALILFLLIIIIYVLSYLRFNFQHFQASSISDDQLELALSFFNGLKLENNEFTINDKPINISPPAPTNPAPTNPASNTNYEDVTIKLDNQVIGSTTTITPYRSSYKNLRIISSTYSNWQPENNDLFDITTDGNVVTLKNKPSSPFNSSYNNNYYTIRLDYD